MASIFAVALMVVIGVVVKVVLNFGAEQASGAERVATMRRLCAHLELCEFNEKALDLSVKLLDIQRRELARKASRVDEVTIIGADVVDAPPPLQQPVVAAAPIPAVLSDREAAKAKRAEKRAAKRAAWEAAAAEDAEALAAGRASRADRYAQRAALDVMEDQG